MKFKEALQEVTGKDIYDGVRDSVNELLVRAQLDLCEKDPIRELHEIFFNKIITKCHGLLAFIAQEGYCYDLYNAYRDVAEGKLKRTEAEKIYGVSGEDLAFLFNYKSGKDFISATREFEEEKKKRKPIRKKRKKK